MSQLRRYSFFALSVLVAMICLRLGIWQLSRLEERRARNAAIESKLNQPPLDLNQADFGDDLAYRHVIARGALDPAHQILLQNRALDGRPGYHLVTPMRLEGSDKAVLVDRGWISIEAEELAALNRYQINGSVTLIGIAMPSQEQPSWRLLADPTPFPGAPARQKWRLLDLNLISPQIPYTLLTVYVGVTEPPVTSVDQPIPDQEIDLTDGSHLAYALQWFAFAAIALGGGGYWLHRVNRTGA